MTARMLIHLRKALILENKAVDQKGTAAVPSVVPSTQNYSWRVASGGLNESGTTTTNTSVPDPREFIELESYSPVTPTEKSGRLDSRYIVGEQLYPFGLLPWAENFQ